MTPLIKRRVSCSGADGERYSIAGNRMQPVLHGPRRNLRPGVKSQFVEDMLNVCLSGLFCDHEKRADLAVGVTARDLGRDFAFSGS